MLILALLNLRMNGSRKEKSIKSSRIYAAPLFYIIGLVYFGAMNLQFTVTFNHYAITTKIIYIDKITIYMAIADLQ